MQSVEDYLAVPRDYAEHFGSPTWAATGDALEMPQGGTFAFAFQTAAFLEGFATQRPLVAFGFVLHMLHFLRGSEPSSDGAVRVRVFEAFRAAGRSHRNAGAFFAMLCAGVPPHPDPPLAADILWRLQHPPFLPPAIDPLYKRRAMDPPWQPEVFEARLIRALAEYELRDLVQWFRHGRGPVAEPKPLVEAAWTRPRTLDGALAELAQNSRLSGAIPYVDRLVSALALPRRRLENPELPLGGYCDVTTRGDLAHVLPGQFALDSDEFVRRFAERELLFFRREEPHARTTEELVVVLDQGVRTWGAVRLMLAAAVFALGRLASRKGQPFRIAATSGDTTLDPLTATDAELAALVEASDLSGNPGEALERVLMEATDCERDVVLLTHPLNLADDVATAARRLRPGSRLFAVAVDAEGDALFAEMRRGVPVAPRRFRIDLQTGAPPKPQPAATPLTAMWSGDVEPIPFPFRFGLIKRPGTLIFDFDHAGARLLIATQGGMLYALRTDGSDTEILPRPMLDSKILTGHFEVLGVVGGFVILGKEEQGLWGAHYEFRARRCIARRFREFPRDADLNCLYDSQSHKLILAAGSRSTTVDLATGEVIEAEDSYSAPEPFLPPMSDRELLRNPSSDGRLHVGRTTRNTAAIGRVAVAVMKQPWQTVVFNAERRSLALPQSGWGQFTPLSDGRPALAGWRVVEADCQGATLAVDLKYNANETRLHLLRTFRGPDGIPAAEFRRIDSLAQFCLSRDGKMLALMNSPCEVAVYDALEGRTIATVAAVGRLDNNMAVKLGDDWLCLSVERTIHLLRWDNGKLVHECRQGDPAAELKRALATAGLDVSWATTKRERTSILKSAYDGKRFIRIARREKGSVFLIVDVYGQVVFMDRNQELLAMMFIHRNEFAAWTPQGARFGSQALLGKPPTDGADKELGRVLWAASHGLEWKAPQ